MLELRYFARLLTDGAPATFSEDHQVNLDTLWTNDGKKVFRAVQAYLTKYHTLPSLSVACVESGVMIEPPTDDPLTYWVDQLHVQHRKRTLVTALAQVQDDMEQGKIDDAEAKVMEYLRALSEAHADQKLVYYHEGAADALDRFKQARMEVGMTGVTYGFPYLDRTTRGAQKGDLIVIAGRPKVGKTWTLLHMANAAFNSGKRALIITTEQTHGQIIERLVCMRARVNARRAQLGRIANRDLDRIVADVAHTAQIADGQPLFIYKAGFRTYIDDITILIDDLKPDAVYVDGAYLLRTAVNKSEKTSERVSNVAEDLKSLARDIELPVFATYQFNRSGAGKGKIYQSDAVEQLASVLFGVTELRAKDLTVDEDRYVFTKLQLIYGRDGEKGSLQVQHDTYTSQLSQHDVIDGYMKELDESEHGPDFDASDGLDEM